MNYVNGSKIEILPGTREACSGPHPPKVHADEIELMPQDMFVSAIRELLLPDETPLQFDERTGHRLHVYPNECGRCGHATPHGVIVRGFPRAGESWCLRCGADE